jgi:hypothetical protein
MTFFYNGGSENMRGVWFGRGYSDVGEILGVDLGTALPKACWREII